MPTTNGPLVALGPCTKARTGHVRVPRRGMFATIPRSGSSALSPCIAMALPNSIRSWFAIVTAQRTIVRSGRNMVMSGRNMIMSWRNMVMSWRNRVMSWRNMVMSGRNMIMSWHNMVMSGRNVIMSGRNMIMSWHNMIMSWRNRVMLWLATVASVCPVVMARALRPSAYVERSAVAPHAQPARP